MSEETLQLWPGGQSVQTTGVSIDYPDAFQARFRDPKTGDYGRWHKPTAKEARAIEIERLAERLFETDVLCCDSALIGALQTAWDGNPKGDHVEGFDHDDIENLYLDPSEWTAEQCQEWLVDCDGYTWHLDEIAENLDHYRGKIQGLAEPAEVFEWYRVSKHLCDELRSIDEVVLDNDYGEWWGRTCTGQQLIMDGTLQKVAAAILDR